jgi:hypothetical protein
VPLCDDLARRVQRRLPAAELFAGE